MLWPAESHGFDTLAEKVRSQDAKLWPAGSHGFDTLNLPRTFMHARYGLARATASIH